MKYRLATHDDAEAIRTIYNREVLGSTVTFDMVARTAEDQLAWMDEHSGAHPAVVAVDDLDRVCGFGSLSPYRPRPGLPHDGRGLGLRRRGRRGARASAGGCSRNWCGWRAPTVSTP